MYIKAKYDHYLEIKMWKIDFILIQEVLLHYYNNFYKIKNKFI